MLPASVLRLMGRASGLWWACVVHTVATPCSADRADVCVQHKHAAMKNCCQTLLQLGCQAGSPLPEEQHMQRLQRLRRLWPGG